MPYSRPGVYVEERALPNVVAYGTRVAVANFIGVSDRGPTTPERFDSWGTFVNNFGGFTNSELHHAVYHYFANGGRVAHVTRVVGSGALASTVAIPGSYGALTASTGAANLLTISAQNPGVWGNSVTVSLTQLLAATGTFDLTVYYQNNQVEVFRSLSVKATDPRYVESVVNSASQGSAYISASVLAAAKTMLAGGGDAKFNALTGAPLAAGAAGSAPADGDWTTAINAQSSVEGPFLLNLAGMTTLANVNTALNYAAQRLDTFVIIDADAASSAAKNIGTIPQYTKLSFGAVYYPRVVMNDPSSTSQGGTRISQPSGAIMGIYVTTDATRGVFKAPAGVSAVVGGALALEHRPTNAEMGSLNDSHINCLKSDLNVNGITVWGARTLKMDTLDGYIPVRRSLIYLKQALEDACAFAVFEPNDARLWDQVQNRANKILTDFWNAGGLKGLSAKQAFYATCDASNNTDTTISAGEVHLEVGVALQVPAEFVIIQIGLWAGGTVTNELL